MFATVIIVFVAIILIGIPLGIIWDVASKVPVKTRQLEKDNAELMTITKDLMLVTERQHLELTAYRLNLPWVEIEEHSGAQE